MRRIITLTILTLIIVVMLFLPIKIPYTLESIGNVVPVEEWTLVQDIGGSMNSTHKNNKSGIVDKVSSWQFERGDLYTMEVSIDQTKSDEVHKGDTIVRMYSTLIAKEILELENQLKVKTYLQEVLITGEKNPIIEEAESKLKFAKEALTLREKEFDIAAQLKKEEVSAPIEYTRAQNALELAKINVSTAEKTLIIAKTGVKSQTADVNTSEINSLKKQLDFLKRQNARYVITAPFDGKVAPLIDTAGVIIKLQNVNEVIVTIPVKTEEMMFTGKNPEISITDAITGKVYKANILYKSARSEILNGRSVSFIQVLIHPESNENITLGVSAKCKIKCDELTPLNYLKRVLNYNITSQ